MTGRSVETFGIAAGSSGVGATHFSILLANYQNGVRNRKTALLEWNDSGDFEKLEKITLKKTVLNQHSQTFKLLEVSYVKKAGKKELLECVNKGYDVIIIDFGSGFERHREEFLRCDRKFLIGSLCEWKIGAFMNLMDRKKSEEGRWEYLAASGNRDLTDELEKKLRVSIKEIPRSSDAFAITGEIMVFFEGFLKY